MARPQEYNSSHLKKAREYLDGCIDEEVQLTKQSSEKYEMFENKLKVKLPSKGGLAVYLKVDWAEKFPEFSDIMEELGAIQEERLMNAGLSGDYNPTIAKVLLTKHGYREGIDQTTNDKELPTPILNGISTDNSNKEDSKSQ